MNGWWAGIGLPVVVERLEQREVDDPEEVQPALGHRRPAELEAQQPEHVVHRRPLVGDEQQQVAGLGLQSPDERRPISSVGQELGHG